MTRLTTPLLFVAAVATLYAGATFLGDINPDFKISAIIGVLALGAKILIDYVEHEKRRRMAEYREAVWARRCGE